MVDGRVQSSEFRVQSSEFRFSVRLKFLGELLQLRIGLHMGDL
jgi:hypothetical protein